MSPLIRRRSLILLLAKPTNQAVGDSSLQHVTSITQSLKMVEDSANLFFCLYHVKVHELAMISV